MKLAVRVVKALPRVLNNAAVPAFEIAARVAGAMVPSKPVATNPVSGLGVSVGPGPPPRNCVVAGAPVIENTAEHVSFFVRHGDCHRAAQRRSC